MLVSSSNSLLIESSRRVMDLIGERDSLEAHLGVENYCRSQVVDDRKYYEWVDLVQRAPGQNIIETYNVLMLFYDTYSPSEMDLKVAILARVQWQRDNPSHNPLYPCRPL